MTKRIRFDEAKEILNKFFCGRLYPIVASAIVLFSHIFGIEFYLNFINVFLCILSFLVCDSVKPFIPVICTYAYQFSRLTNLSMPDKPDFYYSGFKLYVIITLFCLAILSSVVFFIKYRKRSLSAVKRLPILPAAILLSAAFLMNGAFSDAWVIGSFGFGAVQIATFFVIFYFFTVGLEGENAEKLVSYFSYVTAVMAGIPILETLWLYLSGDLSYLDGSVVKESVNYGWGNWNTAGQQMVMTLPLLFYGVMKNRYPWIYFSLAILTVFCSVLTLSRNALILSLVFFAALSVVCMFFGQVKKAFRVLLPVGIFLLTAMVIVFWGKISLMLGDYLDRGLSDNGRFELWKMGFDSFLEAPVFGKGFFGAYPPEYQDGGIFPMMAHNTLIELLCGTGLFGLAAYIFYRVCTVRIFVIRPTLSKTMLGLAMLTVIVGSMLDNFIFYYHQMLYYPIACALAFKLFSQQKGDAETGSLFEK